jgi:GTP pyrophosphokinase
MQKDVLNNLSDLEEMKIDFFQNRIFVLTPSGDVIDLPEDATAIDFAYSIHTEIGHKGVGAMINEQMSRLETPLKNGDVVEILVDKKRKGPNPDWLKIVKTNVAKSSIKSALNINKKHWLKSIIPAKKGK